jgi:cell division protein FtsI (penicillin-binding protein 3)
MISNALNSNKEENVYPTVMNDQRLHQQPREETTDPVRSARIRLRYLQSALILFFVVVCLRLVQIQVIESIKYRKLAQTQYQSRVELPAARGMLYDRHEDLIASNSMFVSFAADPKLAADDARSIALAFSKVFGKPKSYYLEKLESESRFVWLERQVDLETAKKIDAQKLSGIVVRKEPKRLYYNGLVGGQLIGCTNIDNVGIAGIELQFENDLRGADGYVVFQRDGLGRARPSVDYPRVEPVNGNNIVLTIDLGLQAIAEKELKKGIEQNHAERGIVVMMEPQTGEVLALAQYPSIDPNSYGKYPMTDQRLRAVTDIFEPGSVFKIVTASAALEYQMVKPDKMFFAENGTYTVPVGGGKFRTITDTHKEGWITFQQAIEFSSNIVMAKISDIIGSEKLYKTARDYGFGIPTNIEFPGEASGILKKPMDWSGTTLNTIAYGYEVSVSPIQIAAAYAAVANGGVLMKPHLYKKIFNEQGQVLQTIEPQMIRRVISESTAKMLTDFFEGVVLRGTAKPAAIPGIRIAGKTGTSKKIIDGQYQGNYTASFVGFLPVEHPRLVCLVMMDNPRGVSYYGGTTSAPVFRAIVERVLTSSDLFAPQQLQAQAVVPDTSSKGARVASSENVNIDSERVPRPDNAVIPDVRGLSIRHAMSVLENLLLEPVVNGSGVVVQQSPESGKKAKPGTKIFLMCQPKSAAAF